MKRKLLFHFLLLIAGLVAYGQNPVYFVSGNYANPNTWSPAGAAGAMTATGFGSTYQLSTTANGTGLQYFRFNSAAATSGAWYGPVAASTTIPLNTATTSSAGNTTYAYALNITTATDNIVFNAGAGAPGTAKFVAFDIAGTVRTVTAVAQSAAAGTINPGQAVTITATISGAFASGQSVYLRYSKDGWATSTVVQMTGAATTYTAAIPAGTNTASANVSYYVFTSNGTVGSGAGPLANGTDADLFTINANNNGGAGYSYTVNAVPVWYWVGGTAAALTTTTTTVLSNSLGGAAVSVTLGTSDKIIFDGTDVSSAVGLQTGSITISNTVGALSFGQLVLQNNANITYSPSSTYDISLNGGTGTDLVIGSGSVFSFGASSNPKLTVLTGATGTIAGTVNIGVAGAGSQQVTGADAAAITFQSGSICNVNAASGAFPFGSGTSGSVVFASGATLKHTKSDDIFGGTGKTVVVFQTGSTYEYNSTANASYFNFKLGGLPNKIYADVIINCTGTFSTSSYTNSPTIDNLTIASTNTTLTVNFQDAVNTLTIKGNLINNSLSPLNFTPSSNGTATINFSGSTIQNIINKTGATGGITFGSTSASRLVLINVNSGSTVRLGNGVDVGNFTLASPSAVPANTIVTVKTGGTLDMLTSTIYGLAANTGGSFITETGATVKTGHLSGLSTTAATGAVQTQTRTYHSGASYVFNGTGGAQVTGNFIASTTPTANTVNNLTIDNTSGVTFNIASGTVNINAVLALTNGIFNTITNSALAVIPSGASVSRTNGWVYGSLKKYVSAATSFEVGDNLYYSNVTVTGSIGAAGLFTVKTNANGDHPNIASSDMDASKSENTYWTLTNNSVTFSSGASLVFNYPSGNIDGGATAANFKLGNYNGSSWTYPPAITAASNSMSVTGITAFGDFQSAQPTCVFGTWNGSISTDWNVAGNWCGGVPTSLTDVIIPNVTNKPVINAADAFAKTITIDPASSLTMSGIYNLTISGSTFTNNAGATGFNAAASTGAVIFTAATATISGTTTFQNVIISNGLDFGTAATVNGVFKINPGGYVSNNHPPVYACNATLLYNTGGTYGRGSEWKSGVSAGQPGYPGNVQLSTAGTYLNFGTTAAVMCGSLTIDAGTTFDMGSSTNNALTINGNINVNGNLYLSMGFGGDLYVGGNYTVGVSGTVFNNNRATFFNGASGNQVIAKNGGGTVYFDYMIINKGTGDVQLSNVAGNLPVVQINSSTNNASNYVLQFYNGNLDLNGQTFILNGTVVNSTNIYTAGSGAKRIYTSTVTANFNVIGTALAGTQNLNVNRASAASSLIFDANVTLAISVGVDFGPSGMTLINSIFQINSNGFCINNSPNYGSASFLVYNNGSGGFDRNMEWNSNVAGPGYPNNIIVQNNTPVTLSIYAFTAAGLGCTGYIDIKAGASINMGTLAKNLSVGSDIIISGSLTLSTVAGGDLNVGANFTRTGSFVQNNRNVTFNGSADGKITATGGQQFSFVYLNKSTKTAVLMVASSVSVTDEIGFTKGTLDLRTNNEFVTLLSTATKTARVAPSDAANTAFMYGLSDKTGQFIVQRYVPARRSWRLMAAPLNPAGGTHSISEAWQERGNLVAGLDYTSTNWAASVAADSISDNFATHITGGVTGDGFDQSPTNSPSIKYYNSGAWQGPANTNNTSVNSQEGWMLFVRGDRKTYGEITTQFKTPTVTTLRPRGQLFIGNKSISSAGLTVVGNPYAAAVDFNSMVRTGTGWPANPTYYVWDPYLGGATGQGAFVTLTWNGTDFTRSSPYGASSIDNRYIPSGAAIMVDFPAGGGTLNFAETDKATANTTTAFRPVSNQLMTVLNTVNADQTTYVSDAALSLFGSNFNNDADVNDALKLSNFTENFSLERDGKKLSVERRRNISSGDTIFYNIAKMQRKNYQLQFIMDQLNAPASIAAFLEDTYLKKKTPVNMQDTTRVCFSINTNEEAVADRFRLVFRQSTKYNHLKAFVLNSDIAINWAVSDELNIDRYEIERSANGTTFTVIGTQKAGADNEQPVAYSWLDVQPAPGEYYYRIKSISKNAVVTYSDVVKVKIVRSSPELYVFPNPVTGNTIQLQLNAAEAGTYAIKLFAGNGQLVMNQSLVHNGGTATKTIQPAAQLTSGTYQLQVTNASGKITVINVMVAKD